MDYSKSILAAIEFIEGRLLDELTPADVAARIGFSEYHFHRIFHAMLGETMASYIRKRRISEAAKLLKTSSKSIFEIALLSRFETHESFSRAFKKIYGMNPGTYKKTEMVPISRHKERMTRAMIEHLQTGITLNPRFEIKGPELAVGLARGFPEGSFRDIECLWDSFASRCHEVPDVKEEYAIGVCMGKHPDVVKDVTDTCIYMAGVLVTKTARTPKGMVACAIPKAKYAVFTHTGSLDNLPRTVSYIWGTWIPKNIEDHAQACDPDFELYDRRFDPKTRSGEFEIYVPVSAHS